MDRVKVIVNHIIEAATAYYTGETLIMTDNQFDSLVEKLRTLDPKNPILSTPGWGYKAKGSKEPHEYGFVGSLDVIDFNKCSSDSLITPKYDGISISVEYQYGKLHKALTRNTGIVGKNITHHIISMLPLNIPFTGKICFKGEAVIDRKIFAEKYASKYANERNFVAGVINRLEVTKDTKDIDIVFYQVMGYSGNVSSLNEKPLILDFIKLMGLSVAPTYSGKFSREDLEKWSKSIEYLTDGIVLTHNVFSIFKEDRTLINEDSNSHKFESEEKEAIVDYVEWSTGGAGRVGPVVILTSPISLSGVNVQRATAHNALYVKESGIGTGAIIRLKRANEVIPYINSVAQPVLPVLPSLCPACNSRLEWYQTTNSKGGTIDGKHLICPNPNCIAQTKTSIFRLIEVLEIGDGLGEATINKWLDLEGIKTIINLLDFANDLNDGKAVFENPGRFIGKHYGNLILNLIEKLRTKCKVGFSFSEFWFILNLQILGHSTSKKMSQINPEEMLTPEKASKMVKGIVPEPVHKAIKNQFIYWNDVLSKVYLKKEIEAATKTTYRVCITGKLNGFKNRNEFVKYLEQYGVEHASMSKKTNFLISNEDSTSGKSQKAKKLGVPVVTEEYFLSLMEN